MAAFSAITPTPPTVTLVVQSNAQTAAQPVVLVKQKWRLVRL